MRSVLSYLKMATLKQKAQGEGEMVTSALFLRVFQPFRSQKGQVSGFPGALWGKWTPRSPKMGSDFTLGHRKWPKTAVFGERAIQNLTQLT